VLLDLLLLMLLYDELREVSVLFVVRDDVGVEDVLDMFVLCLLLLECCWLNALFTCLCAIVVIRLSSFGAEMGSSSLRISCTFLVDVVICRALYWAFSCFLVDCCRSFFV